jgi:hypothetical protein
MIKFKQIGAANGVDQHRPMFDRPSLDGTTPDHAYFSQLPLRMAA